MSSNSNSNSSLINGALLPDEKLELIEGILFHLPESENGNYYQIRIIEPSPQDSIGIETDILKYEDGFHIWNYDLNKSDNKKSLSDVMSFIKTREISYIDLKFWGPKYVSYSLYNENIIRIYDDSTKLEEPFYFLDEGYLYKAAGDGGAIISKVRLLDEKDYKSKDGIEQLFLISNPKPENQKDFLILHGEALLIKYWENGKQVTEKQYLKRLSNQIEEASLIIPDLTRIIADLTINK